MSDFYIKNKKTIWVILIVLIIIIVYYLYKQNLEHMDFGANRLICDRQVVNNIIKGCFEENLTGIDVKVDGILISPEINIPKKYYSNKPHLKLFILSNTDKDIELYKIDGKTRPREKNILENFKIDFNKIEKNNFADFNLIIYESKYLVDKDTRFNHIAFLYSNINKKIYKLMNKVNGVDFSVLYNSYANSEKSIIKNSYPIITDNADKTHYNTFIMLSNPALMESWLVREPQKNIYDRFITKSKVGESSWVLQELA